MVKLYKDMKEIIVIGGGGHSKSVICLIKKLGDFRIIGYLDNVDKGSILGIGYLGNDNYLKKIINDYPDCSAVIGIGNLKISSQRRDLKEKLEQAGFKLPALISPTAIINEEVRIGNGSVIMDGVIINSGSSIGECAIINTASVIDHDCNLGDFVHLAPSATLSGGVEIGENSIIGAGATVIQYKKICVNCIIGAGAVVTDDCNLAGTYVGVPARKI